MEDIMEDNFEKLNLLLEQEQCEFVDIPDGFTGQTESGELRLIYLMNVFRRFCLTHLIKESIASFHGITAMQKQDTFAQFYRYIFMISLIIFSAK